MSIKYKLPLLLLAAFILNILLILGYYRIYLEGRVELYQTNMQTAVAETTKDIQSHSADMFFVDVKAFIAGLENERNLRVTLQNTAEQVFQDEASESNLGYSVTTLIHLKDGDYLLKVEKEVDLLNLKAHNIFENIFLFEICVVFFIFAGLSVTIHFFYVRRLLLLDHQMKVYKSGQRVDGYSNKKRKVSKEEIGQLEQSFYRLADGLSEEKKNQNRMIASISHDLKTPLTSVLGYSERILKKDLTEEKKNRYLSIIYNQAKDIEAIVEEFDDYIGSSLVNKQQLQPYPVHYLERMLREEYDDFFREHGCTLQIRNQCEEQTVLEAELLKIRRVFANIFGNSIRHNKDGGVNVTVDITKSSSWVSFSVSDDGVGVSKEEIPHLFEPFFTSDKSRQISGLGLSICRQIIEGHSGTIDAAQNAAGGLTILIMLPVKQK